MLQYYNHFSYPPDICYHNSRDFHLFEFRHKKQHVHREVQEALGRRTVSKRSFNGRVDTIGLEIKANIWVMICEDRPKLTAINILIHDRLLRTLVHRRVILRLGICSRAVDNTGSIHQPLKNIPLPAKDVVSMIAISSRITEGPDEWLRSVRRPVFFLIELARVPNDLEEHLRDAHRVASWAGTLTFERAAFRIGHVLHVIGAVEILPVPARGEADVDHDAVGAGGLGELEGLGLACSGVFHAGVSQLAEFLHFILGLRVDISSKHTETLSKVNMMFRTL